MQRRRQPSPIFSLSQLPTYASRSVEYIDRLASQSRIFMSSIWKGGKGLKTEQADLFEESYSKKDDRLPVLEVERSRGEKCLHIKFMILDLLTILPTANIFVRINDIGSDQQRSGLRT